MKVLLIGNGGRESALAWKIAASSTLERLYVAQDHAGWPDSAEIALAETVEEIVVRAVELGVDLVVIGPEAPLAEGLTDRLEAKGIAAFGPNKAGAELESSKAFAKEVLETIGVMTPKALVVDPTDASKSLDVRRRLNEGRVVIKANGLAAGKGVFVCQTESEAREAYAQITSGRFGEAISNVLLEDLIEGPEVSVFALTDGNRVVALPTAMDHKRLREGDEGPNTGGMGAFAPSPLISLEQAQDLVEVIHLPVIEELRRRGIVFRGVLYGGLMLTRSGPSVLEFNVRFGDPECQALMSLWEDDILPWLHGAATGRLPDGVPSFVKKSAVCVVMASAKYPESSTKGVEIPEVVPPDGVEVFIAAAKRKDGGGLETSGGRVLGVTAVGETLDDACQQAYQVVDELRFEGAQVRNDIGARFR